MRVERKRAICSVREEGEKVVVERRRAAKRQLIIPKPPKHPEHTHAVCALALAVGFCTPLLFACSFAVILLYLFMRLYKFLDGDAERCSLCLI